MLNFNMNSVSNMSVNMLMQQDVINGQYTLLDTMGVMNKENWNHWFNSREGLFYKER